MTSASRRTTALAMLVFVVAGCSSTPDRRATGNGDSRGTPSSSGATAHDKAVKFTECMHANGVHDFPDPNAAGEFPNYGVSVSPAQWSRALAACKELQPPGSLSAKLTPKQLSTAVKFAQCMRAHGVKDFPDPVNGQPLIDTTKIPSSNRPGGMAILNATVSKCVAFLRAAMAGH